MTTARRALQRATWPRPIDRNGVPPTTLRKQRPARVKALANAAFAGRFPRRKKKDKKRERKAAAVMSELAYLQRTGIERDHEVPLVRGQKREKGRYMP